MGTNTDFTTLVADTFTGAVVGNVTGDVTGDMTGDVTGDVVATAATAAHGAGAIGTSSFGAPQLSHRQENSTIITEIKFDITGLACKGDAADDAIGLAAGGAAYIGRYVVATYGIVYKVELSCIELPGEGTATITADIDIAADSANTHVYDGAVGGSTPLNTASLVAGEVATNDVPALTANDYLYLVEGDTAATTGVYDAGQYILRFYGHALLA